MKMTDCDKFPSIPIRPLRVFDHGSRDVSVEGFPRCTHDMDQKNRRCLELSEGIAFIDMVKGRPHYQVPLIKISL
jgi:hypothetical protein